MTIQNLASTPPTVKPSTPTPCDHRDYQAGDIAGCPTCVALATAAAPRVTTTVHGAFDFGVSATGKPADVWGAVLDQIGKLAASGAIGAGADRRAA